MKRPMKSPLIIQQGGGDFFDLANIQYFFTNYLGPNVKESIRLLPDSVFYGSLILALVTQSYPTAIFAVALLESGLIGSGIRNLISYMDLLHTLPEVPMDPSVCDSSYFSPTIEFMLHLGPESIKSAFPSFPVFFLATACSYVVSSLYLQKDELEALGKAYSARFYISIFASFLLLLAVSSYRLAYGCNQVGVLLLTLFLGFLIGLGLVYQMYRLLGRNAINLTGVPLLRERTRDGKPLYVCPKQVNQ